MIVLDTIERSGGHTPPDHELIFAVARYRAVARLQKKKKKKGGEEDG